MNQLDYFTLFSSALDLDGKDVLEIGGAIPPSKVLSLKVKSWTSIDINERRLEDAEHSNSQDTRYKTLLMSAENMGFEDQKFDVIFSGNCFEHIFDVPSALAEMYRVLRNDGILFTKFSPIWSGPIGHHTWVWDEDNVVAFWQPGGVFPDWYHLSHSEEELSEFLEEKYNPKLKADILKYVYRSNDINRWIDTQYINEISNYNYNPIINHTIKSRHHPSNQVLETIRHKYPEVTDFRTLGFYWILSKSKPTFKQYLRAFLGSFFSLIKIKLSSH